MLETNRLKILPPTKDSLDNRHRLLSNPNVTRFLGNTQAKTRSETQEFLEENIKHYQEHGLCLFDIFLKESGEFIGDAGLIFESLKAENKNIEVGYRLLEEHWGNGYASELAEFFIKWGFEELHLDRIIACCDRENVASSNVMKKCGMSYQGRHLYDGRKECDLYDILLPRQNLTI